MNSNCNSKTLKVQHIYNLLLLISDNYIKILQEKNEFPQLLEKDNKYAAVIHTAVIEERRYLFLTNRTLFK